MHPRLSGTQKQQLITQIVEIACKQDVSSLSQLVPHLNVFSYDKPSIFFQALQEGIKLLGQQGKNVAVGFLMKHDYLYSNPSERFFANEALILTITEAYALGAHHSLVLKEILSIGFLPLQTRMLEKLIEVYVKQGYLSNENSIYRLADIYKSLKSQLLQRTLFEALCKYKKLGKMDNDAFNAFEKKIKIFLAEREAKKQHLIDKYRITSEQVQYFPELYFIFFKLQCIPKDILIQIAYFTTPLSMPDIVFVHARMHLLSRKEMLFLPNRKAILTKIKANGEDNKLKAELEIEKKLINASNIFSIFKQGITQAKNFVDESPKQLSHGH